MDDKKNIDKAKDIKIIPMEDLMPTRNQTPITTVDNESQNIANITNSEIPKVDNNTTINGTMSNQLTDNQTNSILNQNINSTDNNANLTSKEIIQKNLMSVIKDNNQSALTKKESSNKNIVFVIFAIIAIGVSVYLLFSNNNKRLLTCKKNESYIEEETSFTFINDEVKAIFLNIIYDFSVIQSDELQQTKDKLLKTTNFCQSFNDIDNDVFTIEDCKEKKDGDRIILSIDLSPKVKGSTLSSAREYFENQGYQCEVK